MVTRLQAPKSSIGRKVMLLVLTTTFVALLVAAIALVVYEVRVYRADWVDDLTTQADILARSTAPALAFEDARSAEINLALLRNRAPIRSAAIYRPDGSVFATYSRNQAEAAPATLPAWRGWRIERDRVLIVHPVLENDELLGFVHLTAHHEIGSRVLDFLLILGAVMLGSLALAFVLATRLQRKVTRPIIALTHATRRVIAERDFSARVERTSDDEVGVLVDAFNVMLEEVGERSAAVEASNRSLQAETEERRAAEAALREADRRKDEFLATLAHELRNPLAPMVNAIALLKRGGTDAKVIEHAHALMERQLAQLVRLVDDLLDVARITTGKLTVRRQPAELGAIIRSAVDTARPLIDSKNHSLEVRLPHEPIFLSADATRLAQVFSNLLNNAAKYTDDGGRIELEASVDAATVRVMVRDNGIGIDPRVLPGMFDMFAQADHSLERRQAGLGVGLTLARRLVELHNGTLEAHSPGLGQGTTFTVCLPVIAALAARGASQHERPLRSDARRILLVDDNPDFAESLAALLETLGHQVRVAHDAREALRTVQEFEPDFAFLDIGLPDINGYQLAGQLRELPRASKMKLVAVSGWGQERDRERSRQAGFALHLVKPVELEKIQSALSTLAG